MTSGIETRSILSAADLEALIEASHQLAGFRDAGVIAGKAARRAQAMSGADLVGVAVREGDRSFAMLGTAGDVGDAYARMRLDVDRGLGLTGTILSGGICLAACLSRPGDGVVGFDPDTGRTGDLVLGTAYAAHLAERLSGERLEHYLGAPIVRGDRIHGVLYAGMRAPNSFTSRQRALLARFATMLAPAFEGAAQARHAAETAIAREREEISLRLHDTIGQILFGIGTRARRALALLPDGDGATTAELSAIEQETARAAAHLREIFRTLTSAEAAASLPTELEVLAGMFRSRTGLAADVIVTGMPREIDPEHAGLLAAIAREGLHNAEKHAGSSTVVLLLHVGPTSVTLSVQDDGAGVPSEFRIASGASDGARMGLAALARRAARLGGTLTLEGGEDGGATLKAVL